MLIMLYPYQTRAGLVALNRWDNHEELITTKIGYTPKDYSYPPGYGLWYSALKQLGDAGTLDTSITTS
jgi:hypothetical protein